jgi:hypothetical protein
MRSLALLLLLLVTLVPIHANTSKEADEEKLSATEEEKVRQFVNHFAATIKKTRDLTPYLNRPPASNLLDQALHDPKDPVGLVVYNLGSKIGKYQLRKFNIALWNLSYLSDLYIYSRFRLEKTAIRDLSPQQQYPSNVVKLMKRNSLVNKWWHTKDLSDSETVVTTVGEFRSILGTFQRAIVLMRQYFRNRPPEHTAIYKQNLEIPRTFSEGNWSAPLQQRRILCWFALAYPGD